MMPPSSKWVFFMQQHHGYRIRRRLAWLALAAVAGGLGGCVSPSPTVKPPAVRGARPVAEDGMARAEALYRDGQYEEALRVCVDLSRGGGTPPPGLESLRVRVVNALYEQRALRLTEQDALSRKAMSLEASEKSFVPDTYGSVRYVEGLQQEAISPVNPIFEALNKPVSLHLKGAQLAELIDALSRDGQINLIADAGVTLDKALDVDLENVPLREVLDFIARNYPIQFHYGQHIVWITSPDPQKAPALETRIYQLTKGVQLHGGDWGKAGEKQAVTGDLSVLTLKATVLPEAKTYIEEIIGKFIPAVAGAQLHIDPNTHTLFVRNTRENLEQIDRIVTALDVNPPQVLIEARFIEVAVSDLREIGIDWILDSPLAISSKGVIENGQWTQANKTQVAAGEVVQYTPYTSDSSGAFPLGPQGSFGLTRDGNPPTASQGLNLTYQGVLTEPMFSAVLHAIEISGRGKTLSVPRVTTINNNPAKLRNGQDLLYFKEFQAQAFALVDANNQKYTVTALIPNGKPDLAELGITLVAVPSVGADLQSISLLLTPTISKLEGFVSYQDDSAALTNRVDAIRQVVVKLPIISRREVQTKVVVDSGETVVMGGLIDTVEQETVHRVPILGSLPLIGPLFRRTDVTEERRNLIIFVTATVMSERGESLLPAAQASPPAEASLPPVRPAAGG